MTGTTPLLSIVVPFHNVAAYLEECLTSIQRQLVDDIQVIMVDDESTDESPQIARRFVESDPRFQLVRQRNQGPGIARNTGIDHATGRYLAFADGDDVVTPRGYAALLACLEETGSDIAAGNAYRFSEEKGVHQSWTHRRIFAKSKLRTTISKTPLLVRDRMMWNKVYRRSFWDAGGYRFPDMRVLEDYIVALQAYLEASSVDMIAQHVYLWRNRPSGDSITQQGSRLEHARDRFVAVRNVLDIVADHATDVEVRSEITSSFQHVDLVSLAESMVTVPEADRPEATQYAVELARMLDPALAVDTSRLSRLVHRSLLRGDIELVEMVASWRLTGDTRGLVTALRDAGRYRQMPVAVGAAVARRKRQNPLRPRKLRSSLVWAAWIGQELHLTVLCTLRTDLAKRVDAQLRLLPAHGRAVRVPVDVVPTDNAVQLHARISVAELARIGDWKHLRMSARLATGPLRWRGPIALRAPLLPAPGRLPDGTWAQLRGTGWHLGFERLADPVLIERVTAVDGGFLIRPVADQEPVTLQVKRPFPTTDLTVELDGETFLPVDAVLRDDPPDNPVTGIAERPFVIDDDEPEEEPLSWLNLEPDEDEIEDDEPEQDEPDPQALDTGRVLLLGHPVSSMVGETVVSLTRGWYGSLVVRQAPLHTTVAAPSPVDEPPADLLVAEEALAALEPAAADIAADPA